MGYAAVAEGDVELVRQPKVLSAIPVRVSAGLGLVYFSFSLFLVGEGGVAKEYILPVFGIFAAFVIFVYRTVTLVAGWAYRRRLRAHEQQGSVVFVPLELLQHTKALHEKENREMPSNVFDVNLGDTKALVDLYSKESFSPKVKKQLRGLIGKHDKQKAA